MKKCEDYKRYGFDSEVPIINNNDQIKQYLDKKFADVNALDADTIEVTVKNVMDNSISHIHHDLHHINCHINSAKEEIIDELQPSCNCKLATKEDIKRAVNEIKEFTQEKIDEMEFDDLNAMVREIKNKLDE